VWSGYTTLYSNTAQPIFIGGPNVGSPFGGGGFPPGGNPPPQRTLGTRGNPPAGGAFNVPPAGGPGGAFNSQPVSSTLLDYLQENYNGEKYFVAVASQQEATGFILNNNIGNVMTLGGFSGRDKAITVDALQQKISAGEIRFFLLGGGFGRGGFGGPRNGGDGGGMFNANQDITTWVQGNCTAVSVFSGLYDCSVVNRVENTAA
jgi:hypothetical protein